MDLIEHVTVVVVVLFCFYHNVRSDLMIKESGLELTYNVTEYNHCLVDEFKLKLYVGRHLKDCVTACALRSDCKVLTYQSQFGSSSLCELFQSEGSEHVVRTGCVYIQRQDINVWKMPCTTECIDGTTCNIETKLCEHTECTLLPSITNGHILGNLHAVGNIIRFKCNSGISTEKRAVCQPDGKMNVSTVTCIKPTDCKDLYAVGYRNSGVYRIYPVGYTKGIQVRCDMNTPPGGWTIIQRRIDERDFYKTWSEYKAGFGDVFCSFWMGNDLIWKRTSNKQYRLRIDLTAQDGMTGYAQYDHFSIEDETLQYTLNIGGFHGDVGDSLSYHNRMQFSTHSRDNDRTGINCAVKFHGAWWYNDCHHSNLNGDYMNHEYGMGLLWYSWRGHYDPMKQTEMKICPANE